MSDRLPHTTASNLVEALERVSPPITPAEAHLVTANSGLAEAVMAVIRDWPPLSVSELFPDPEQQIQNVRRWLQTSSLIWNFGPGLMDVVAAQIPKLPEPTLKPLQATFLVPRGPKSEYRRILAMLWQAVERRMPAVSRFGPELEDVESTDDLDLYTHSERWRLEWVQVFLDDNQGQPLLRDPIDGHWTGTPSRHPAGDELPTAAAHSPLWAGHLGGKFPQVALGGCRWQAGGAQFVPVLGRTNADLVLYGATVLPTDRPFAQPTVQVIS